MSMMQATAIISARDLASGVFARVAASARAASGRYASAAGTFAAAGHKMHGALAIAAPTALGIGAFGHDQYEWDRAVHQYRAIAELAPQSFGKVEQAIMQTSNAFGVSKMELLEAAKGWQELGNSPESFIKNAGIAARTSRITGVSVAEQMKESSALLRAFGADLNDPKQFQHYEEVYLVASKGMKGGAHAFGEAMQSWAPVAASLHLSFEQAAAFAQTLGGQFDPGAIGNALKTGFMRIAAPVPKSAAMLRSEGIDPTSFAQFDESKMRDGDALVAALKGTGSFNVSKGIQRIIEQDLQQADLSKGIDPLMDKLNHDLVKGFGGKHVSAQDRKILQATLLNFFSGALTGVDPEKFFKAFHGKSLAFMAQVFGKEHAAKFMDLLKQWEHYEANLKNIEEHAPGALERKWSIFGEGFAFQWDRVTKSIDNMMNSIGGSGIRGDMTGLFKSIADTFDAAQNTNPQALRAMFWGIAGLAALAPAGYVISGIASSLALIGSIASSPIVITIAGAAALYELYQHWEQLYQAAGSGIKIAVDFIWPEIPAWVQSVLDWMKPNPGHATGRGYNANPRFKARGPDWFDPEPVPYVRIPKGRGASQLELPPLRLLDLSAQQVNVTGQAQVTSKVEATIKVDGPGRVTDQKTSGGQTTMPLNTGRSMPDTAYHGRGSR